MSEQLRSLLTELRSRAIAGKQRGVFLRFRFTRPIRERAQSAAHQRPARGSAGMTQAQENLLIGARDSLLAAKLLHPEGHHRFAASRAYYAMFYQDRQRRGIGGG